MKMLSENK